MSDRIIIGESQQAGLPISAPIGEGGGREPFLAPSIRWVKRGGPQGHFVLEAFNGYTSQWQEVPFVDTPNEKASQGE